MYVNYPSIKLKTMTPFYILPQEKQEKVKEFITQLYFDILDGKKLLNKYV